ncbi:hypothetical protein Vadar_028187 [Vaccinium darrowii]|uniref:Uncharacterized protein n=1 Tax=Vaccinium darrowii TaxID=229202 RepID=A0ACB7XDC5_9ERIC|nr:hypothetical protein Vadar_028187 [Vaccinium darrowii]
MVFSSIPVYSDHPNWHQVQQGSLNENSQLQQPPPLQVGGGSGGSGGGSSIRPGSMVDRARLAKVPQPEAGLNCPRCDSTNTKFCYFNNYSLTQPRHFCKACRRYWTRGGALRNVPVGGGYRKNKRSKSNSINNSSKSQASTGAKSTSVSPSPSSCSHFPQPSPQFSFMATLQGLGQYGGGNVDSNIAGFQAQMAAGGGELGFQMGNNSGGISSNLLVGGVEQWRLPFLGGLDHQQPTNYQTPVKMEDSHGLNFSRQFIGGGLENNQYWSGNQWAEFSGVNSSSTSQLL